MTSRIRTWPWILAAWALIFLLRSPFWKYDFLNPDEALFTVIGEWVKAGYVPYRDIYDFKPPGLHVLYAAVLSLSPWNVGSLRIAAAIGFGVIAVALARMGVRTGSPRCGGMAAVLFAVASSCCRSMDFQAAESELFVILFTTLGFWSLLDVIDRGSTVRAVLWGTCGFLAVSLKQPGIVDFAAMSLGLIVLIITRQIPWRSGLRFFGIGILSGALCVVAAAAYFWFKGCLNDAIYFLYSYPKSIYVEFNLEDIANTCGYMLLSHPIVFGAAPLTALLGCIASLTWFPAAISHAESADENQILRSMERTRRSTIVLASFWMLGTYAGALLGGHSFPHYFVQTLPAASLLISLMLHRFFDHVEPFASKEETIVARGIGFIWIFACVLALVIAICFPPPTVFRPGTAAIVKVAKIGISLGVSALCLMIAMVTIRHRQRDVSESSSGVAQRPMWPLLLLGLMTPGIPTLWQDVYQASRQPSLWPKTASQFSDHVRVRTVPGDKIYVWGFAMHHYVQTQRLPAAGDPTSHFLSGWDPEELEHGFESRISKDVQSRCLAQLEANPPRFVIDYSECGYVPMESSFPAMKKFMDTRYKQVDEIPVEWWRAVGVVRLYELKK